MTEPIDWREAEDITAKVLPSLIERAQMGDREASLRLIGIFCGTVDSKRPPYPELLTYLSNCLALVLEGVDANRALGLERPPGRPRQRDKWLQDDYLANKVLEIRV